MTWNDAPSETDLLERTNHDLEFDEILSRAADGCRSELGRELVLGASPAPSRPEAEEELAALDEMRRMVDDGVSLPVFPRVGATTLERLSVAGLVLDIDELCAVRATLRNLREVHDALGSGLFEGLDRIRRAVEGAALPEKLLSELERVLDEDGRVRESASPALRAARRRQLELRSSLETALERLMRAEGSKDCFEDAYVTTINDRYVIPVKTNFKGKVGGVVQGASRTGHTVFMEPMAVVEMNNDLIEAVAREQAELARILGALSDGARAERPALVALVEALSWLDALWGKASYARRLGAVLPRFSDDGRVDLVEARHPLIETGCVPVSIAVEGSTRVLVLSGANSGGKTVTLKTMGLLTLMARTGLFIPAAEGTVVPFASRVFVEMGDSQSIAENLSSFSSHVTHVVAILAQARGGDMVLLDELMSGTDPEEGAALAEIVLEELGRRGCLVVTTTHFGRLKLLGQRSELFRNAAVEFDAVSLRPTYRLVADLPGASYGFEISRRFGMAAALVEQARELLGPNRSRLSDVVAGLEQELRRARAAAEEAARDKDVASRIRADLEERQREFDRRRRRELADELERARQDLLAFRREVEARLSGAEPDRRTIVRSLDERIRSMVPPPAAEPPPSAVVPGSAVRLPNSPLTGRVISVDEGRRVVTVDVNGLVVTAPLGEVTPVGRKDERRAERDSARAVRSARGERERALDRGTRAEASSAVRTTITSDLPYEVDLRGLRAHEAVEELERILDLAVARNQDQIRVIHGKGTGTLRREVERILAASPVVRDFRPGGQGEGDFGVTVVRLR